MKAIGEHYLWVDAYCIRQHDPEDVKNIVEHMGSIYGQAFLTIIAAAGDGAEHGLSRVRSAGAAKSDPSSEVVECRGRLLRAAPSVLEEQLQYYRWSTRGWVS